MIEQLRACGAEVGTGVFMCLDFGLVIHIFIQQMFFKCLLHAGTGETMIKTDPTCMKLKSWQKTSSNKQMHS